MSFSFPLRHRHGHYDLATATAHHQTQLAATQLAPATEATLREALGNLHRSTTPKGLACRREIMELLDAAARKPAADRPMPTSHQADELLDRSRFDLSCNPHAVDTLAETAQALLKLCKRHRTHIPNDVGRKVWSLHVEIDRLAQTSARGIRASTLRQLHQTLEGHRLVIEGCARRVQRWMGTALS